MPFPTPRFLVGHEVYRVKPGTFFDAHHKHAIDGNGNLTARYLSVCSVGAVYFPEIYNGNLRDVTANPQKKIDFNPPPPPPPKWKRDLKKRTKENKAERKAEREAGTKTKEIQKPKRGRPKGSTNRKPKTGGKK